MMKNERQIIEYLNTGLRMELTAQAQYMLQSRQLEDWGFQRLAGKMAEEAAEEKGHAESFIDRILFLGGVPSMSMDDVKPVDSVESMLKADLADEQEAVRYYTEAYQTAGSSGDIGSKVLFSNLVLEEEGHVDWLQTQLGLMESLGKANYLQNQVAGGS